MIEAFEIGVSLALQDGVSDAIGQARRDVAALEHAVRESGVSLRSLREVGARSASVSFGERRMGAAERPMRRAAQEVGPRVEMEEVLPRLEAQGAPRGDVAVPRLEVRVPPAPDEAVVRVEKAVAAPLEGAAAPRAVTAEAPQVATEAAPRIPNDVGVWPAPEAFGEAAPLQESAPLSHAGDASDVRAQTPRPDTVSYAPFTRAPAERPGETLEPAGAFVRAPIAAAQLVPLEDAGQVHAPLEVALRADDRDVEDGASAHAIMPVATLRDVWEAEPQTQFGAALMPAAPAMREAAALQNVPKAEESTAPRPVTEKAFARQITLMNALRLSGGSAAVRQDEDDTGTNGDDVVAPYDELLKRESAPSAVSSPMVRPRAPQAGAAAPDAKEKTTEQAGAKVAGPHEGDVFLDGMLVGRWMSRFLNREAERASAGPTGFDARRGRLLPGVTVGG